MSDLILEKCKQFCIEHFGLSKDTECHEGAYLDDWGADELDRIELTVFAENTFEIEFSDEEIDCRMMTFGTFVSLIKKKVKQ